MATCLNSGDITDTDPKLKLLSIKLLPSVYHSEPKSGDGWAVWTGKWKRGFIHSSENKPIIRWRKESDDTYIVQDTEGVVWLMNEMSLKQLLRETN